MGLSRVLRTTLRLQSDERSPRQDPDDDSIRLMQEDADVDSIGDTGLVASGGIQQKLAYWQESAPMKKR
jgi:hypothetical protein